MLFMTKYVVGVLCETESLGHVLSGLVLKLNILQSKNSSSLCSPGLGSLSFVVLLLPIIF